MGQRFTPLTEDRTTRLEFDVKDVEVLSGSLHVRGRGKHATVRIDGVVFEVHGAPCGSSCFCDATLHPVPSAGTSNGDELGVTG